MQCTPEQIAAKRKLALQKLAEKKNKISLQNSSNANNSAAVKSSSPAKSNSVYFKSVNNFNNTSSGSGKSPRKNLHSINIASARNVASGNVSHVSSPVKQFNAINNVNKANYNSLESAGSKHFNFSNNSAQSSSNSVQSNYFKVNNNFQNNENMTGVNNNYFKPNDQIKNSDKISTTNFQQNVNSNAKVQPSMFFSGNKSVVCKMTLISSDKFALEMSGFSTVVVDVIKTIPSRFYEPKTRIWSFNVNDYDLLLNKLLPLKPDVQVEKLPQYVINCCRSKPAPATYDFSRIDSELLNALMPFQEEGVCFGIDKNGRCLIGDDMGLGKTFQALAIANYYKTDWPLLIVTTASMKNVWEETIHKYITSVPVMSVQYMISGRDYINNSEVLIVSHDLMSRCVDKLMDRGFGVMIIDESHVLKNFKAKCTRAAQNLAKRAKRVILLSGTPALSRPSELYSQLSLINDKFFGSFFDYSKRYCDGKTTSFGWDASGQSNLQELEIILGMRFMIRRTKEDVLKSLPNKTQEIVTLDVNLNIFSEDDRKCLLDLSVKYNTVKKDRHAALLTFFAETAKIKIPSVCSYVLQTLESNQKFLVFAHHQIMLDSVEKVLLKKKKKFIRIDGNTSCDQRKYYVDKFQNDENYVCAVLSITAANAGITLTAAKLVLFAELHWNPSILSQAEARAHRIGQEGHVIIQYLLAPGTADDSIWPLLQNKQKTLKEIGLMHDSFSNVESRPQNKRPFSDISTDLNSSITSANTLDITTYFKASPKRNKPEPTESQLILEKEFLNDDFDDLFTSVKEDKQDTGEHFNKRSSEKENGDENLGSDMLNDDLDDVFCNLEF